MSNLFYKNQEYRLVDVKGVVLASPGDFIVINEPGDFDTILLMLERKENHGVNSEITISPLVFDKNVAPGETLSSRNFLEQVYAIDGTDSEVNFQYILTDDNEIIYEGELQFSQRKRVDYGVEIIVRRVDFQGKINTRLETEYDLNRTEDIDGNPITPIAYNDILLIPQAVSKKAIHLSFEPENVQSVGADTEVAVFWGNQIASSLEVDLNEFASFAPVEVNEYNLWKPLSFGYYTFEYAIDFEMEVNGGDADYGLQLAVVTEYADGSGTLLFNEFYNVETFTNGVPKSVTWSGTTSEFPVNANTKVRFFIERQSGAGKFLDITIEQRRLTVNGVDKSRFIETKYVEINEGINKHIEGITGVENALVSPFLAQQKAALITGKLIRGFPETETFKMTLTQISQSLRAIFGLGWALLDRPNGDRFYIDRYSEFYRDELLHDFGTGTAEFEEKSDEELVSNEILIGYQSFSEGSKIAALRTDSNADFCTQYKFQTPIVKTKDELSYISPILCSGQLIEEGRQLSLAGFVDEKWDFDEKVFLISLEEANNIVYDQYVRFRTVGGGDDAILVLNFIPTLVNATSVEIDSVTYTVTNVTLDEETNTTYIETSDVVPGSTSFRGDIIANGTTWISPETSEAFDVFNNADPNATYNARYNIKYMLFNQSLIINSVLHYKPNTDLYRLISFLNNATLETQFKVGEGFSTLDPDRLTVLMSDDIAKEDVNQGNQLWQPDLVSFNIRSSYTVLDKIRKALRDKLPYTLTVADSTGFIVSETLSQTTGITAEGTITEINGNDITVEMLDGKFVDGETVEGQTSASTTTISSQSSLNYGFIRANNFDGVVRDSYLKSSKYNPTGEMEDYVGRIKI